MFNISILFFFSFADLAYCVFPVVELYDQMLRIEKRIPNFSLYIYNDLRSAHTNEPTSLPPLGY